MLQMLDHSLAENVRFQKQRNNGIQIIAGSGNGRVDSMQQALQRSKIGETESTAKIFEEVRQTNHLRARVAELEIELNNEKAMNKKRIDSLERMIERGTMTSGGATETPVLNAIDGIEGLMMDYEEQTKVRMNSMRSAARVLDRLGVFQKSPLTAEMGVQTEGTFVEACEAKDSISLDDDDEEETEPKPVPKTVSKVFKKYATNTAYFISLFKKHRRKVRKMLKEPSLNENRIMEICWDMTLEKHLADKEDIANGKTAIDLDKFVFQYFLKTTGLKSTAVKYTVQLIQFLSNAKESSHSRILLFKKLLNMWIPCVCKKTLNGKCICEASKAFNYSRLMEIYSLHVQCFDVYFAKVLEKQPPGKHQSANTDVVSGSAQLPLAQVVQVCCQKGKKPDQDISPSVDSNVRLCISAALRCGVFPDASKLDKTRKQQRMALERLRGAVVARGKVLKKFLSKIEVKKDAAVTATDLFKALGSLKMQFTLEDAEGILSLAGRNGVKRASLISVLNRMQPMNVKVDEYLHELVEQHVIACQKREAKLMDLFRENDADGDGVMSLGEFQMMIATIDPGKSHRAVLQLFEEVLGYQSRLFPECEDMDAVNPRAFVDAAMDFHLFQ
eukprot:TRINITY_DN6915_c0_g2_i1.p1 TRINITY_DN6915_c0_g2~~TRINITY_DN6915_c0_g2_i1.p1  ORF type:complete len:705 (-),score=191.41 TRINITY_DN6915_c0_g2_i1:219-2063(-)